MKVSTYYLTLNMIFNCKHVIRKKWYHSIFGEPSLTVAQTESTSHSAARKRFKLMGHSFGVFDTNLINRDNMK